MRGGVHRMAVRLATSAILTIANPLVLNSHSYAIQREYSNQAHQCVSASLPLLAVTHDFNNDGKSDLLWRNTNGDVAILLMNGTQVSSAVDLGGVPTSWTEGGTGDLNGDGRSDIIWRNTNGDVAIWLMNGTQISSAADLGGVPTSWS